MKSALIKFFLASMVCFSVMFQSVQAGVIHGGSDIIKNNDVTTLLSWLGHGDFDLQNIFTKQASSNSNTWHSAVDGQGPTFTIMEVIAHGNTMIVGGYNQESWFSYFGQEYSNKYNYINASSDSSFLFNLTTEKVYTRIKNSYSTLNVATLGATFGGGNDFVVESSLNSGYNKIGYSYGDFSLFGTADYQNAFTGSNKFQIGKYETFVLTPLQPTSPVSNSIPEPNTLALFALSLLCFRRMYRR